MPNPNPSAPESGQDGSGALRAEFAAIVHAAGCGCAGAPTGLMLRSLDCDLIADGVLAAGYRRVAEDDATVTRVVEALAMVEREQLHAVGLVLTESDLVAMARAAVRAVLEGGDKP